MAVETHRHRTAARSHGQQRTNLVIQDVDAPARSTFGHIPARDGDRARSPNRLILQDRTNPRHVRQFRQLICRQGSRHRVNNRQLPRHSTTEHADCICRCRYIDTGYDGRHRVFLYKRQGGIHVGWSGCRNGVRWRG